jgi:tetratricopeptide (TPR) repeat protein
LIFRAAALLVALASADPKTLFDRARGFEQREQWAQAEAAYREFLRVAPGAAEGHGNLGVVLSKQGKFDQAAQSYRTALKLKPGLTGLQLNLGLAYYKAERREEAIAALRRYLVADPDSRQARQLLATALLETDQYAEAARMFESLMPSDDFSIRLGIATAYTRLKRPEARALLAGLVQQENTAETQLLIGQAHLAANEFDAAEAATRKALELRPEIRGAHFLLGAAAWKRQDAARAIAAWRDELARDPRHFESTFALGAALAESGNRQAALPLLEQALAQRPQYAPALYYLGKLAHAARQQRAQSLLELAVKLDPSIRPAHYLLAQIYRVQGRTADAERALAEVRKLSQRRVQEDVDILAASASR